MKQPEKYVVEFLGQSGDRPEGDWCATTEDWKGNCVISGTPEGAIAELRIAYNEHYWSGKLIDAVKNYETIRPPK